MGDVGGGIRARTARYLPGTSSGRSWSHGSGQVARPDGPSSTGSGAWSRSPTTRGTWPTGIGTIPWKPDSRRRNHGEPLHFYGRLRRAGGRGRPARYANSALRPTDGAVHQRGSGPRAQRREPLSICQKCAPLRCRPSGDGVSSEFGMRAELRSQVFGCLRGCGRGHE